MENTADPFCKNGSGIRFVYKPPAAAAPLKTAIYKAMFRKRLHARFCRVSERFCGQVEKQFAKHKKSRKRSGFLCFVYVAFYEAAFCVGRFLCTGVLYNAISPIWLFVYPIPQ